MKLGTGKRKTKSWFFDKMNIIDRTLIRITKKRREDSNTRDEKRDTARDFTDIKR